MALLVTANISAISQPEWIDLLVTLHDDIHGFDIEVAQLVSNKTLKNLKKTGKCIKRETY